MTRTGSSALRSGPDADEAEWIADEALLDPRWEARRAWAVATLVARRLAEERGVRFDPTHLAETSALVWYDAGVEDENELAGWLEVRGLDETAARRLVEAEAFRRWGEELVAASLDDAVWDQLLLADWFPDVAARARTKRRTLEHRGSDGLAHPPGMRGMHDLLAWWRTGGHPVRSARSIERWFGGWSAFQRIATREYLYGDGAEGDHGPWAEDAAPHALTDADLRVSPVERSGFGRWSMLGPLDDFAAERWGRRVAFAPRSEHGGQPLCLTMTDLEQMLASRRSAVRVLKGQVYEPDTVYRPDGDPSQPLLDPGAVLDELVAGSMLVLHRAQEVSPAVDALAAELEAVLGLTVDAKLFVSPPASVTQWHPDPTDNFVVQVRGTKRWVLAESTVAGADVEGDQLDRPVDLVLEPGDVLYVPRGAHHRVVGGDAVSVHVTFCCSGRTWNETLLSQVAAALDSAAPSGCRTAIPPGRGPRSEAAGREVHRRLQDELRRLVGTIHGPARGPRPVREAHDGALVRMVAALEIGPTTPVRRSAALDLTLRADPPVPELEFGASVIRFPPRCLPAVVALIEGEGTAAGQLALEPADALVLVRRFVAEGILEPIGGPP